MTRESLSQGRVQSCGSRLSVCNSQSSRLTRKGNLANERESGSVRIAALVLLRFIPRIEKTANHLGKVSLEWTHGGEWNIEKTMLSAPFHELGFVAIPIDLHHNEEAVPPFHLYDLTQEGDFGGLAIRFNNNAGYSGTH